MEKYLIVTNLEDMVKAIAKIQAVNGNYRLQMLKGIKGEPVTKIYYDNMKWSLSAEEKAELGL